MPRLKKLYLSDLLYPVNRYVVRHQFLNRFYFNQARAVSVIATTAGCDNLRSTDMA